MASVRPFRGFYYNQKKTGKLENVIVPPYDVISEAEKKAFIQKSPYNFARITLGSKQDGYRSVAKTFSKWKQNDVLIHDDHENFYFWEQSFRKGKRRVRRQGIVAAVALRDYDRGKILAHEKTFEGPKADRLKLLKACKANLSPIFMMYDDSKRQLEKRLSRQSKRPLLKVTDKTNGTTRVWKIEDKALQARIHKTLRNKSLYIIDGHHRFFTALNYRNLKKGKKSSDRPQDYVLSVITNVHDPAIVVYPIYRVLPRTKGFPKEGYLASLKTIFDIRKRRSIKPLKKNEWGIMFRGESHHYILKLNKKKKPLLKKLMNGHASVKSLDVEVLQQIIIPRKYQKGIRYVRGVGKRLAEAVQELRKGKHEALWMVKEPSVEELLDVADHHQIMPAKSTFFFPKIMAGMIIRSL